MAIQLILDLHILIELMRIKAEDILKNVVPTTMGPGCTEVLGGVSQTEPSSKDSVIACTHNRDVQIDQVATPIEKSDQDIGPETEVPRSWEELHGELPL